jgi:hypothetical protein
MVKLLQKDSSICALTQHDTLIVFGLVFNLITALISASLAALTGYMLYRENCRRDKYPTENVSNRLQVWYMYSLTQYYRINSDSFIKCN